MDITLGTLAPSPTADSWEGESRDTSSASSPREQMPGTSSAISPGSDPSRCVPLFYNVSEVEVWRRGSCKISGGITALVSELWRRDGFCQAAHGDYCFEMHWSRKLQEKSPAEALHASETPCPSPIPYKCLAHCQGPAELHMGTGHDNAVI